MYFLQKDDIFKSWFLGKIWLCHHKITLKSFRKLIIHVKSASVDDLGIIAKHFRKTGKISSKLKLSHFYHIFGKVEH